MRKMLVFAGLLAAPADTAVDIPPPLKPLALKQDPRPIQLRQFFEAYDCPLKGYADDFVMEADENELDWRLLPSISFVESTGGKYSMNNNVFGWDSCNTKFRSVRSGIHEVATSLGRSSLYRDKRLDEVLKIYNSRPGYGAKVKAVMSIMGPPYFQGIGSMN